MKTWFTSWLALALTLALIGQARADEGMWPYDEIPAARVEKSLGVKLDRPWLDHLLAATVRLTNGCSGAVVSRQGLVLTNQHCLMACAQSLSTPGRDLIAEGDWAYRREIPRACPGMQAEILIQIIDITTPVFDASARKYGEAFVAAREGVFAKAEKLACRGEVKYRCQVMSFFGGGQFKIYKYRVFRDVRLVFLPEYAIGFYGGDRDNFDFPRHALDAAFLRLYENGVPAVPEAWLSWTRGAPKDGDPVFVSGNPGVTDRALTMAQLEAQRDLVLPINLEQGQALRDRLVAYAASGAEAARLTTEPLFAMDNTLKLLAGRAAALHDTAFLQARGDEEAALKARVAADAKLAAVVGDPWGEIAAVQKIAVHQYIVWRQLDVGAGGGSQLYVYARMLVRGAMERVKPTTLRLPEYADSRLALVEKSLLDDRPTTPDLERLYLQFWLTTTRDTLGRDSLATKALMDEQAPDVLAKRLAEGSALGDPAQRRALWRGGLPAILASDDPMIAFVLKTDPVARAARDVWEQQVVGPSDHAAERIAQLRFLTQIGVRYPDATFSPRLSFGKIAGWRQGAAAIGPFTTFAGLFSNAEKAGGGRLPPSWAQARSKLDAATVLDFVTTNDITGGSSGSAVVDAKGRIVGAAFDGNLPSIAGDFAYDGAANRTVAVSTAAITEALAKIYGREDLVAEVEGR